eukprot:2328626-Rhodomonas_salina.1
MLAFDIETTGFIQDIPKSEISVVCTIDTQTLEEKTYNFMAADAAGKLLLREQLISDFQKAPALCAYNAVLFDIPFMDKQLNLGNEIITSWLLKLCDPFHAMKTAFNITCKLDKMLFLNGLECKSADGAQAIVMAHNKDWPALVAYCMDDVRLTGQLCELPCIKLFEHIGKCTFSLLSA